MRVVGGELRGRPLASPRGDSVRPTSDRVREALFSVLGEAVHPRARVLDLYCGTGALAIEALSRGAAQATLVDRKPRAARRNIELLGLEARARIVGSDSLAFLGRDRDRYDVVFCDPPYRLAHRLGPELSRLLPGRLSEGARVISESSTREPLDLELPLTFERAYGETLLRIHDASTTEDG